MNLKNKDMKCSSELNFQQYIDGECTPLEKKKIEQHLNSCPACKNAVDQQRARSLKIKTNLKNIYHLPNGIPGFEGPALKTSPKKNHRNTILKIATLAAAACMVLFFTLRKPASTTGNEMDFYVLNGFDDEVDANLPYAMQDFEFHIIDANSKLINSNLE